MWDKVKQSVSEAEMVLVGIGTEFAQDYSDMESDPFYGPLLSQAAGEEEGGRYLQYLQFHHRSRHPDGRKVKAYQNLGELLEGKNYFAVSLCTDGLWEETGLKRERMVTPCGNFDAMQCVGECAARQPLMKETDRICALLESMDGCGGDIHEIQPPVCPVCKKPLWFNQISTPGYREEGYLGQWAAYTKWLQGTLHRRLCILELGVGLTFPQIVRFPFEKIAFFNQKAYFYRIHSKLYQLAQELNGRGISIAQSPVDFFGEKGCAGGRDDSDH